MDTSIKRIENDWKANINFVEEKSDAVTKEDIYVCIRAHSPLLLPIAKVGVPGIMPSKTIELQRGAVM